MDFDAWTIAEHRKTREIRHNVYKFASIARSKQLTYPAIINHNSYTAISDRNSDRLRVGSDPLWPNTHPLPKGARMKHTESTIHQFVMKINHEFFLPAIQRKFVWKELQISNLFDSIMRGYPIGSFLIWRTKSHVRKRKFVKTFTPKMRHQDLFLAANSDAKSLVLDGQQRIQSLLIGIDGQMGKKCLHFNIASAGKSHDDGMAEKPRFEFEFMEKSPNWKWVPVNELLSSPDEYPKLARKILSKVPESEKTEAINDRVTDNIARLVKVFKADPGITTQLLDSTEDADRYTDNDVLEIFVRANSGGTKLQKSELLFALLATNWDGAESRLEELESELEEHNFVFSRDYFLKACLILLGKKASYNVKKFRDKGTLAALIKNWKNISGAITDVVDFLPEFTPIANSKALPSDNALLPLIAYRYFQPKGWRSRSNKILAAKYLLRTSIVGTYNGAKDDLLDALVDVFKNAQNIDLDKVFSTIKSKGRATTISSEQFFNIKYGNSRVLLIMKLLRPELKFVAANPGNAATTDHLISRKLLKEVGITGKDEVDQLANLIALSARENEGEKKAKTIKEWLDGMKLSDRAALQSELYLPADQRTWTNTRFTDFIKGRKALIANVPEIKVLLANTPGDAFDDSEDSA